MSLTATATIVSRSDAIYGDKPVIDVETTWSGAGIDRTDGIGYVFSDTPAKRKLARRLVAAINAQRVFTEPKLEVDVDGNTYVSSKRQVMGKYANADLKRLGF